VTSKNRSPAGEPASAWTVIDSHAHLAMSTYEADLDKVLDGASADGIAGILTASTSLEDVPANLAVASTSNGPPVWAAVGVHPHQASTWSDGDEVHLARAAEHERVVAIGEAGLDYHYDFSPRETQREVMARQVRLAVKVGLPIIIHCREAAPDVATILENEGGRECGGVIHCFTENAEFAGRCLELGFHISFSGIVTFESAGDLRQVARQIPENRLLVETDSPYLAPAPHRGKRNEPRRVRQVLETLARERKADAAALAGATTVNFHRLFHGCSF
jgi:TatD DNase family protein